MRQYMIGWARKKVTMLKSLCLQENPWENLLGYSVQNVNIRSNHSAVCSESEEKTGCKFALQNFELFWNHPKNRRWRRCCTTGTCCMRQSHSTHCNSRGYDLISLAAVFWHHTAALRCRAAALRCRTAALRCHTAAMRQPQDVAEALRLSHCLVAQALWLLHSCVWDWEL